MIKKPGLPRKTPEEVASEVRVFLTRIQRRRKRFRAADEKHLREVRKRVLEAVWAGIGHEDVAKSSGYALKTVSKWVARCRVAVQEVEIDTARERLSIIHARRNRMAAEELRISTKARSVIRKAMGVGIPATEFAEITGYELSTVERWFASTRRVLLQAHRRWEIASVRRGKANRPPQELSPVEYDQWLVQDDQRRKSMLRKYGLQPRRRRNLPRFNSARWRRRQKRGR
ncbi:hypothetical protein [Streptomyces sp. H27-H5]|uniref:hypothetical protein n=1 Tax=Streptomyces sp. H27-H5 TaxID=2996460 RepID=UPI0022702649|nr:hypothetical protein [Streptomyces sp. H27-H5]MCY0963360.1 hypothetical protein [Streptomyces sp. H27-H5]